MLERKEEYTKMAEVERKHWWYRTLHCLVLDAIKKSYDSRDIAIIDAGCGTGGLLLGLIDKHYSNVMGFDLSYDAVDLCRAKGVNVVQHDLRRISELYPPDYADVIISNDTFYFFEMKWRVKILEQCFQVLKPNGLMLLNLPAGNAFRGIHDISVGIKQRFSKKDVRILFGQSKFQIIKTLYWPFFLSPLIFLERLRQRIMMRTNPAFKISSDIDMPSGLLNSLLARISSLENHILPVKPFGSSIFLVVQKPSAQT